MLLFGVRGERQAFWPSISVKTAPAPDVETDFGPFDDGQSSMPCLLNPPSTAVRPEILPVDGVARQWLEDDALLTFFRALDERTPP